MKKLQKKGYQTLKMCHLFIAGTWVGSDIVIILLLALLNGKNITNYLDIVLLVDWAIVIPCAFLCLVTGILFSVFTNWGFIKHRWIVIKYLVNLFPIISGIVFHGAQLQNMIHIADELGANALTNSAFRSNYFGFFGVSILYTALFVFVYIISVNKPKFGKKNNKMAVLTT